MNTLWLSLDFVPAHEVRKIDGIQFSSCVFIKLEIDHRNLLEQDGFAGSVVYFQELEKSMQASGEFFIFTCACGIPEDAGWDRIHVKHEGKIVHWSFKREEPFHFAFDRNQYIAAIENCANKLKKLDHKWDVEPKHLISS